MECSNSSVGDGFCDQECMTPDCYYDSVPPFAYEDPYFYFDEYSD